MHHLLHWSGQQQHLLQWLQALGAQEMQWGSSALQRTLITDLHSARELHAAWAADHRGVQVRPDKLEVVASFCYLGDMLSAASGFELSTTMHVKTAWKKFKELLHSLFLPPPFQDTWPCVQLSSCMRSAMLHASETWPLTKPNRQCLQQNDRAMI